MDPARWKFLRPLLDQALDLEATAREHFLAELAGRDPALGAEVARLVAHSAGDGGDLDRGAAAIAAGLLTGGATTGRDWDREQLGRRVAAFQLDQLLGAGGMGTVFRAHRVDGGFEQVVAIKLVLSAHPGLRERFRKEQEILAALNHPNIAQLIDGGETEQGLPFLAMEFVDGVPITDYCREHHPDLVPRLRLLVKVAAALAHAHRNLVIHRDIKPNNILVTHSDGRPKLLDFGIAKLIGEDRFQELTAQHVGPMTPAYAAPEQFLGRPITVATDIYQFGVLMFRLITGRLPYEAESDDPMAWGRAVLEDDPITLGRALAGVPGARRRGAIRTVNGEVHRDLDAIVRMALAKEPNRRYSSMDALIADLEAFLDGRPVLARHGGAWYPVSRFLARHRVAVVAAAVLVAGMIGLTGYAVLQARHAQAEAARAHAEAERAKLAVDFMSDVLKAADPSSGRAGQRSATDLLDIAAKDIEPRLAAHPELRGPTMLLIANSYSNMGLPNRAFPMFRQAIADLRGSEVEPKALARALERGAYAAQRNGDLATAQEWLRQCEALLGDDEDSRRIRDGILSTRFVIARDAKDAAAALAAATAAVENARSLGGEAGLDLRGLTLARRGVGYSDAGRYEEAEVDLTEAYQIAVHLRGEESARAQNARQALAWHYVKRGDPKRGLAELEPLGERIRAQYGERSQEWGNNLFNRANAYRQLDGQWQRAVDAYRAAAQAYRDSASANAGQIAWALMNAAALLAEHDRHGEAVALFNDVERAWQGSIAEDAPIRAEVYVVAARSEQAIGDYSAAEIHLDRALAYYRTRQPDSRVLAETLRAAAQLAHARGDTTRAETLWQQAIDTLRRADAGDAATIAVWKKEAGR